MNIRRTLQCVVAAALAAGCLGLHAQEKEYTCSARKNNVIHSLTIGMGNGGISRFSYTSVTAGRSAYTCEVSAERGDGDSAWQDGPDGVAVRIADPVDKDGKNHEDVRIAKKPSGYEVQLMSRPGTPAECGVGGYLARRVVLVPGSRRCTLSD